MSDLERVESLHPAAGDGGIEVTAAVQAARFQIASERAVAKIARVKPGRFVASLLQAASRARTWRQRVQWLHKAADAWAEPLLAVAACRRGCSHCCHIPLLALASEASLLGEITGRAPGIPAEDRSARVSEFIAGASPEMEGRLDRPEHSGVPCPFLEGHECSVYEHRPLACRTHINLDDDDLLCHIIPDEPARVPYADTTRILAACIGVAGDEVIADIREFFPNQAPEGR